MEGKREEARRCSDGLAEGSCEGNQPDSITFSVPYVPTKRRVRFTRNGRPYTDKATAAEMQGIRDAFPCGTKLKGEIEVAIDAYRPLPKGTPRRVESLPFTAKPDADNIAKAVLDALQGAAYDDDKQVTRLMVTKHGRTRHDDERTVVRVRSANG